MIFQNCRLLGGELPPFAACKGGVEGEVCEADTLKISDLVADCLEHSFDLMEFALGHADLARAFGGEAHGCGARGGFFSDIHTAAKQIDVGGGQGALLSYMAARAEP